MEIIVCVDDTDDLTKDTSTGKIAGLIAKELKKSGGKMIDGISRHQLLLSRDINYTSHNSSMCFEMKFENDIDIEKIVMISRDIVKKNMAKTANPGICICIKDEIRDPRTIIKFGFEAKNMVKTQEEAKKLAHNSNIFLDKVLGDGSGMIGAFAGIGLRLSRCDGAIRGRLGEDFSDEEKIMSAGDFCNMFCADFVVDKHGNIINEEEMVKIGKWARLMYYDGKKCSLAGEKKDGVYDLISHHEKREELNKKTSCPSCENFRIDNDEEEMVPMGAKSCYNCIFRRWEKGGFSCMYTTL